MLTQTRAFFCFPYLVMHFISGRVHQRPEFWKQFGISVGIAVALNLPMFLSGSGGFKRLILSGE